MCRIAAHESNRMTAEAESPLYQRLQAALRNARERHSRADATAAEPAERRRERARRALALLVAGGEAPVATPDTEGSRDVP